MLLLRSSLSGVPLYCNVHKYMVVLTYAGLMLTELSFTKWRCMHVSVKFLLTIWASYWWYLWMKHITVHQSTNTNWRWCRATTKDGIWMMLDKHIDLHGIRIACSPWTCIFVNGNFTMSVLSCLHWNCAPHMVSVSLCECMLRCSLVTSRKYLRKIRLVK